jgi:NADPH-dependent 2,4-dienoyl-CoA reductase/sulfur reductase-like enzyme
VSIAWQNASAIGLAAMTIDGTTVDVLIVGGGPGGLAVARGYREAGGQGTVLLLSADEHAPYARPPLTKDYLRGESEADALPLVDQDWYADNAIDLRLGTPVVGIDADKKQVQLADGSVVRYQRLALATGSSPSPLPVPGADLPGVVYVRDRHSGEALRGLAEAGGRVVVLGSGFIGCEAAASLARRGAEVVLVTDEDLPHAARLGAEAGARIAEWLRDEGVELVLGDGAAALRRNGNSWEVQLESGRLLTANGVISGSGARPNLTLADAAGLEIDNGGVVTNAELQTSDPAVWALGDIAYAHNPGADRHLRVEHWGEAAAMGEIVGANLAGEHRRWDVAPGFWSTIGDHDLKYSAWGDGYDRTDLVEGPDGWAVWYSRGGIIVGVLAENWDEAYERGQSLIEQCAPLAEALRQPSAGM